MKLDFENLYCVEVNGRVGGLTLFWKKGMNWRLLALINTQLSLWSTRILQTLSGC
jgi:hypothetical protein